MDEARRYLEMIRQKLGARDVRLELGLEPPSSTLVSAPLAHGVVVVAHFDGASTTDLGAARETLVEVIEAFREAGEEAAAALASSRPSSHPPASGPEHVLTEALESLTHLAKAELALVIDDASPEIWGASDEVLLFHSTDDALSTARLDARMAESSLTLPALLAMDDVARREKLTEAGVAASDVSSLARQLGRLAEVTTEIPLSRWLRIAHSIAAARGVEGAQAGRTYVRAFAGIYRAILVYEGTFSELHAEGALLRALPTIEKLVTALPPRDPVAGGAKVAVLRRLRRV